MKTGTHAYSHTGEAHQDTGGAQSLTFELNVCALADTENSAAAAAATYRVGPRVLA